jgi:hypothetical protein
LVVVVQQPTQDWQLTEITALQLAGAKVVVSTDDALWAIRRKQDHVNRSSFTKRVVERLEHAVRLADAVVTTTPFLQKRLQRVAGVDKPVVVIPNMMDLDRYAVDPVKPNDGKIRIGFEGSHTHRDALASMIPAVAAVMERVPIAVFRMVGEDHSGMLPPVFAGRTEYEPFTDDLKAYPELLTPIDVGLAPSLDNDFYRAKSPLRLYEYGLAGAAVVSTGPTYKWDVYGFPPSEYYSHCQPGEVQSVLYDLVCDRNRRLFAAKRLRRWVRGHASVEAVGPRWANFLRDVLDGAGVAA